MASDARRELVDFLESRAFNPVLNKKPDDYGSDSDRRKLADVQRATRSEIERYRHEYTSAQDVIRNYKDDLTSEPAREIDRELDQLGLPTLRDIEPQFRKKVEELGFDY